MANNESNTAQNPESILPMSEQNEESKKKKQKQTPIEDINNLEKPKTESEKLEQPNSESKELDGQKGEHSLVKQPNVEMGKIEESMSGIMPDGEAEMIGSGRKNRKRKRGKKGNQKLNNELKDGVGMIEQGNDGSEEVKLLKMDLEVQERRDGGNEVGVGNFGQNPERSSSGKKKTLNGAGNGDGCEGETRETSEMEVEEVKKDVEMLEAPRDESKVVEGGDGVGMIEQGNDGSDAVKLLKRDIEIEERKDGGSEIGVGSSVSHFGQNSEHSGFGKEKMLNGAGNGADNREKGEPPIEDMNKLEKPKYKSEKLEQPSSESKELDGQKGENSLVEQANEEIGEDNNKETGEPPIEDVNKLEKPKTESGKLGQPNSECKELEGEKGESSLLKQPNVEMGKIEESMSAITPAAKWVLVRLDRKTRKRKRGKNGNQKLNEEPKDGVGMIEQGSDVSRGVKLLKRDIEIEGRKFGGNEVGVGNNVGKFGQNPEHSGPSNKKMLNGEGNGGGGDDNREKGEIEIEEVKKDVRMLEVPRDENKGVEGGNGEKPIMMMKKKRKKRKKQSKKGEQEVVVQNPEHSGSSKKKMLNGEGNGGGGDYNREKGEMEIEEVKKDVRMLEVPRDENKGVEGGDCEKPILMMKKKKKNKKKKQSTKGEQEVVVLKCFLCDATDHNAKYCPRRSDWFKNKICLICRRAGHSLGNCPSSNSQSWKESASKSGKTKHDHSQSSQSLKVVSAINSEDGSRKSKVASGSSVNKEKAAAKIKAKRQRYKENKKQRKLGTETVDNIQEQEKLEKSK